LVPDELFLTERQLLTLLGTLGKVEKETIMDEERLAYIEERCQKQYNIPYVEELIAEIRRLHLELAEARAWGESDSSHHSGA
jgi:hypothetical protein